MQVEIPSNYKDKMMRMSRAEVFRNEMLGVWKAEPRCAHPHCQRGSTCTCRACGAGTCDEHRGRREHACR